MERSSSRGLVQVVAAILAMVLLVTTEVVQARDYDPACRKNCENKCQNVELRALCVEMCLRTDCMGRPPGAPGLDEQLDALYYCNRGCTSSMCSSSTDTTEGCADSCSKRCGEVYAEN